MRRLVSYRLGLLYFLANLKHSLVSQSSEEAQTEACYEALASLMPPELSTPTLIASTDETVTQLKAFEAQLREADSPSPAILQRQISLNFHKPALSEGQGAGLKALGALVRR